MNFKLYIKKKDTAGGVSYNSPERQIIDYKI